MNKLQKDFSKALKRKAKRTKHVKYNSPKEGRLKVRKQAEEEHRKRVLAEMIKEKPNTTSGLIWKHSKSGSVGYEP